MSALNLKDIVKQQIILFEEYTVPALLAYTRLKEIYDIAYDIGMATKHSTHDSIFYIMKDSIGFKVIKFYNDSSDYRTAYFESPGVAYSMALCAL